MIIFSLNHSKYIVSGSSDKTVKLWLGADWQNWIKVGCKKIKQHPILASSKIDSAQEAVNICKENDPSFHQSNSEKAKILIKQGLVLAEEEKNLKLAKEKIQKAYELDPVNVNLAELEVEVARLADMSISSETLLNQGKEEVLRGNVAEAISLYKKAQSINPDLKIEAQSWNDLCWFGSIYRYAEDVLFACEQAVKLAPDENRSLTAQYRDSRGLAKALTGKAQGAIIDFQFFIDFSGSPERDKRKQWIKLLQAGDNPFTDEVLEELKNE